MAGTMTLAGVAALAPGAELAGWVEGLDPGSLDAAGLADAVVACTRVESWVTAVRAGLMVRFQEAVQRSDSGPFAHAELACALRWPERATHDHLHQARVLVEHLPATLAAWTSGEISAKHAGAVADLVAASGLDPAQARVVEDAILERAGEQTVAQLRRTTHAAVDRADAEAADRRHQERIAQRSVRLCPQPDGMSVLRADLDAAHALTLYDQITAHAETLRAADTTLAIDQARADALVTLVHAGSTALSGRSVGSTDDTTTDPATGYPTRVQVHVTVGWDVLAGLSQDPGYLHGHGPIPARRARELAYGPDATWRRLLTDPAAPTRLNLGRTRYRPPTALADHVRATDPICLFPTCNRPAQRCQLDHNQPYGNPDGTGPGGTTSAENLGPLCSWHHNLKTNAGWTWTRDTTTGQTTWTTPTGHTIHNPQP
jgi:hypothetical protein